MKLLTLVVALFYILLIGRLNAQDGELSLLCMLYDVQLTCEFKQIINLNYCSVAQTTKYQYIISQTHCQEQLLESIPLAVFTGKHQHSSMLCRCRVLATAKACVCVCVHVVVCLHAVPCVRVCVSVTSCCCIKTVQSRITKSSLSAPWKILVSESVKFFLELWKISLRLRALNKRGREKW